MWSRGVLLSGCYTDMCVYIRSIKMLCWLHLQIQQPIDLMQFLKAFYTGDVILLARFPSHSLSSLLDISSCCGASNRWELLLRELLRSKRRQQELGLQQSVSLQPWTDCFVVHYRNVLIGKARRGLTVLSDRCIRILSDTAEL